MSRYVFGDQEYRAPFSAAEPSCNGSLGHVDLSIPAFATKPWITFTRINAVSMHCPLDTITPYVVLLSGWTIGVDEFVSEIFGPMNHLYTLPPEARSCTLSPRQIVVSGDVNAVKLFSVLTITVS